MSANEAVFKTSKLRLAAFLITRGYKVIGIVPNVKGYYELTFDAAASELVDDYLNGGLTPGEALLANYCQLVGLLKQQAKLSGIQIQRRGIEQASV